MAGNNASEPEMKTKHHCLRAARKTFPEVGLGLIELSCVCECDGK